MRITIRRTLAALSVAAWTGATPVLAEPSTFDVTLLAASCANCHGTDGRSPGSIPSIAGRPEAVLKRQLLAFKSDAPPAGTTIMNRLGKGLSDAQVDALARHFSQITRSHSASEDSKR
jgi:sulfide dehydrogenase cytochrome subunit